MAQVTKSPPRTPRAALRRRSPLDRLLEPDLFKALSDPTRVRLLACLAKCSRPCSVTEVAECCEVDFSVVARHLALLARAGVLESTRQGRSVRYAVRSDDLAARFRDLAGAFEQCSAAACADTSCCNT